MARYKGTVSSPHPVEDVWRYMSDLRSVGEWDPSVESVGLTGGEPGSEGARYELEVTFAGRSVEIPYETAEVEAPERVVFSGENESATVRDVASIAPAAGGGCTVTWDADLRLKGIGRLLELPLRLAFRRLGKRAEDGLRDHLNGSRPPRVGAVGAAAS